MTAGMGGSRMPGQPRLGPYGGGWTTENGVITTVNGRAVNQGGGGGGGAAPQTAAEIRKSRSNYEFLQAGEDRANAMAGVEVEMAEQAMKDNQDASQRAASVLGGAGGREVGGGTFSRLRGRRNGVSLGGLLTGGLAGANRAKLAEAKKKAVDTSYKARLQSLESSHTANESTGVRAALAALNKPAPAAKAPVVAKV